ncbi:MAG: 16S rRNA (guanine(527)-N(7))-methyltransferase RsmG [Metamycoplasmataceae bacterium]
MTFKERTFNLIGKNNDIFNDLEKYVELIEETNKVLNLTGFTGDLLWCEGIYQSIILMQASFDETTNKKMLDIGSGAGFPSIPFLIYKRDFDLYICEPNQKRTNFLKNVNDKLSLNIKFITDRIEEFKEIELFDLITARAVTSLKNLIEISSKVGTINSKYSFLKGPKVYEELKEAEWISNELSLKINIDIIQIDIDESRKKNYYLCKYHKTKRTPIEYPRPWRIVNFK